MFVPFNISDLSIVFFAKSRPYEVANTNPNFAAIKDYLLAGPTEGYEEQFADTLIALADPKSQVIQASNGKLEFDGDTMVYGGERLANLWVDKILAFKDEDKPFDAIFKALEDLQANPTQAARERLPVFVERCKLGFLPDGRIAAFKGVKGDGYDIHSGTVRYEIGETVSMPREECDADPDSCCSTGLHVGAMDYIETCGFGWGPNRKMLLIAFWPRHVVAVPHSYGGGKMRVESLDVLAEVDKAYVDQLLGTGRTLIEGYSQPESDERDGQDLECDETEEEDDKLIPIDISDIETGDKVQLKGPWPPRGFYPVVNTLRDDDGIKFVIVETEHDGHQQAHVSLIDYAMTENY